jgi:hypothetical protein
VLAFAADGIGAPASVVGPVGAFENVTKVLHSAASSLKQLTCHCEERSLRLHLLQVQAKNTQGMLCDEAISFSLSEIASPSLP